MAATKATLDLREFRRLALWGASAAGAVALLFFALLSAPNQSRTVLVASQDTAKTAARTTIPKPAAPETAPAIDAKEAERLAATVHALTAERDRLLARIDTLERNLEDITGSIARAKAPPQVPSPADPQPAVAPADPPATSPPGPAIDMPASLHELTQQSEKPIPAQPAPAEPSAQTEFGIDIGRAATVEGLRALWTSARNRHAAQLEGLRPVVYVQEGDRRGRNELRLLAGPIGSAAAAARLCAALSAAGAACRPVVWDNQRLALK